MRFSPETDFTDSKICSGLSRIQSGKSIGNKKRISIQVKALSDRASDVACLHCEARYASLGEAYCRHISTQMSGIEQERNIAL